MSIRNLAPIILFAYNRPEHTRKTLDTLAANHLAGESELFIYIDGAKPGASSQDVEKTSAVKKIASTEKRFKKTTVIASEINNGLAGSVIHGVTETVDKYGKVIVLEDDMLTSPYFLNFLNEALELYKNHDEVACISGYIYPVQDKLPETFFIKGADCWGWGTWKRAWDLFEPDGNKLLEDLTAKKLFHDFNFYGSYPYQNMLTDQIAGRNSSWAIRWYAAAYLQQKLTLYPANSFVQNIGFDGTGTHSGKKNLWQAKELTGRFQLKLIPTIEDEKAKQFIADYFKVIQKKSIGHHLRHAIKSILKKFS